MNLSFNWPEGEGLHKSAGDLGTELGSSDLYDYFLLGSQVAW